MKIEKNLTVTLTLTGDEVNKLAKELHQLLRKETADDNYQEVRALLSDIAMIV